MTLFTNNKETQKGARIGELQGLKVALLAGVGADTKIDLAAIREEDTIISALNNAAGTITDISGTISIETLLASGTLTATTVVADDTVAVNGTTYTFLVAPIAITDVALGASDTDAMANLAAAINSVENQYVNGLGESAAVIASASTNVVTVTAVERGAGGNALTISAGQGTVVASGATLAGGSDTGGIQSTGLTNQVILYWFDKE